MRTSKAKNLSRFLRGDPPGDEDAADRLVHLFAFAECPSGELAQVLRVAVYHGRLVNENPYAENRPPRVTRNVLAMLACPLPECVARGICAAKPLVRKKANPVLTWGFPPVQLNVAIRRQRDEMPRAGAVHTRLARRETAPAGLYFHVSGVRLYFGHCPPIFASMRGTAEEWIVEESLNEPLLKRLLILVVVYQLVALGILGLWSYLTWNEADWLVIGVPQLVLEWSLLGAVAGALFRLSSYPNLSASEKAELYLWVLAKPFVGIAFGGVIYFLAVGGVLVLTENAELNRRELLAALGFLASFSDKFALSALGRLSLSSEKQKSDDLDQRKE
jgi:hypothetical protein